MDGFTCFIKNTKHVTFSSMTFYSRPTVNDTNMGTVFSLLEAPGAKTGVRVAYYEASS